MGWRMVTNGRFTFQGHRFEIEGADPMPVRIRIDSSECVYAEGASMPLRARIRRLTLAAKGWIAYRCAEYCGGEGQYQKGAAVACHGCDGPTVPLPDLYQHGGGPSAYGSVP